MVGVGKGEVEDCGDDDGEDDDDEDDGVRT